MASLILGRTLVRLVIRVLRFLKSLSTSFGCSFASLSCKTLISFANLSSWTLATDKSVRALSRSTSRVFACLLKLSTLSWRPFILALISAIVDLILSIFRWLSLIRFSLAVILAKRAALVSLASWSLASRSLRRESVWVNLSLSFVILFLSPSFCLTRVATSLSYPAILAYYGGIWSLTALIWAYRVLSFADKSLTLASRSGILRASLSLWALLISSWSLAISALAPSITACSWSAASVFLWIAFLTDPSNSKR